jgi:RNA polymerase sigma factor (sigma-70 family)
MNARPTDFELLRDFLRRGDQSAFATVVRRHLGLVYATAMRKVENESAAQEVAQNVFIALARKAWRFAADDSLPAWLYRTTLLEAKEWLRGELRRRRREQTAAELGTTMKAQDEPSAFRALAPLLDDALLSLPEKDRTVLLLRFHEGQSLREVGALVGIREDAARKRVASAIEKVARFFQRRGFKTVTVAVTTAALQQTAVSVSATSANAVVNAALQAAPPALAGLTSLLARFASLSKGQTAAVCAGLAVVSVGWQWQQTKGLSQEAAALHVRLDMVRAEQDRTGSEIERLRAESISLAEKHASAYQAFAREQDARQKLESLKLRSRAMLNAENYRWPDDLPFVRIPKSALSSIQNQGGPVTPTTLQVKVLDFLDLSAWERQATSQIFSNYFAQIENLIQSTVYETNQAVSLKLPPGAESRVFVLQPMGERIRSALDQLCTELTDTLGEERWAMVKPPKWELTHYEQVRLLGYTQAAWDRRQEIAVNIFANPGGQPMVSWQADDGTGTSPMPLRAILLMSSANPGFGLFQGPPVLTERVKRYLTEEAAVRVSTPVTK